MTQHVRRIGLIALAVGLLSPVAVFAQTASSLGSVRLTQAVRADGKPLAAGTYQVRLTGAEVTPAVGQSPHAEKWVEFVKGNTVAGREVATVISAADIGTVAKGARATAGNPRVEVLKGGDYVRVWILSGGYHYLINMPSAGK